jgi:peptide/nickel transport system permease protein
MPVYLHPIGPRHDLAILFWGKVMVKYVLRRMFMMVMVVLCAAVIIFTVMYFVPGDPVEVMLGPEATSADIEHQRDIMGLNDPFFVQLGNFMYNAFLRFDFGISWIRGTSVMNGLIDRLPRTFLLGVLMVLVMVVVGIPLGVSAAINRGKSMDRGLMSASMLFISVPEFWLALMLILVFSQKLKLLPSFGIETWTCYIMPVVAGSLAGVCNVARQTRASVLDVIHADFITTARSKGMKKRTVIYKHMLPNALIPIITLVGNYLTRCVGGTIVIEKIFSFPGIGLYLTDAISTRDLPIIRGCVILLAAFTAILMFFVDLAYGFADPRIKAQYVVSGTRKGDIQKRNKRHHHRHSGGNWRNHGKPSDTDTQEDESIAAQEGRDKPL